MFTDSHAFRKTCMTLRQRLFHPMLPTLLTGALALLSASLALAEEPAAPADDSWQFTAGLGVGSIPKYPGSAEHKVRAFPVLAANRGRYFIGGVPGAGVPAGIGAFIITDPHWRVGLGIGGDLEKPRKESDADRLRGLGDIDGTVLGAVFASYSDGWFTARGNVVGDIGGKHQGGRLSFDVEGKYSPAPGLTLSAGPGVTWASRSAMQTYFGIDGQQAARSGRAVYTPRSGIESVGFTVGADYQIDKQWGIGTRVSARSLQRDAADSPITEKKAQNSVVVFTAYRF
jgi:MipA family protein